MEVFIRYKRFQETHTSESLQTFFDKLVTEGWEIIYYNDILTQDGYKICVTAVCGKRQEKKI